MKKVQTIVQSWAPVNSEPAMQAGFKFLNEKCAMSVPQKYITYRPPKIIKGPKRWYVEYWYRIPAEIRIDKREWKRYRVFENINRYKTDEYAKLLRDAVERALQDGYNPFKYEIEFTAPDQKPLEWSLNVGLGKFLDYCKEKGLRKKSVQSYQIITNFLKDYFIKDNKLYQPISSITKEDIKNFLKNNKQIKGWNNHTYNNYIQFTRTVFNWFVKEEIIVKSPVVVESLPVNVTMHKYYDDKTAAALKDAMHRLNPYLFSFCQFIYYTATRPKSEARLLQVKHILFERNLLFVPAHISKNKKDDYIPLGAEILEMLQDRKSWPADHYVFGGVKPHSQNHMASLFKPFKDKFGLDSSYTLYGFKHLRAIHLAQDGVSPYELMRLFRHSDLSVTQTYLKDLGIADHTDINIKTRKF